MNFPWSKFFHLGLVVPAFFQHIRLRQGPVAEVVSEMAADPFFQALEFSGSEDPAAQKKLVQVIKTSGKSTVFSGGSYCYVNQHNLHDLDEGKRRQAVRNVCKIIDEAGAYGCQILYVMGFESPADRRKGLAQIASSLGELSGYARKQNPAKPLTISVENFYTLKKEPFLIGPTLEIAQIIRDLRRDHPNIGLTFDTSHIIQLKEDLASTYRAVQDVIAHIHLSNCLLSDPLSPFYGDKHPPYGFAGSEIGISDLASFFRVLKEAGHFARPFPTGKSVLSLEVITPSGHNPEKILQDAKDSFFKAWEIFESGNG
jgi:sugar phosphate isomerase/epimerase